MHQVSPEQIDRVFKKWNRMDTPGCVLAIIHAGEIVYQRGYGCANFEYDIALTPESIFDIGSTSKQFTSLCILILSRRGQISMDDPIQKYLPEIPQYEEKITIRHLVHHISGMRDYLMLMALANMPFENDYQEQEVIQLIARQKNLNYLPGEEFLYSNSGYFLLAEIVQRVSGKSLRVFAEENIFAPLGMVHTHFHDNFKEIVKNRAVAYSPCEKGGYQIDTGIFDVLGDGAVYTNVGDLYLWDQNFYHNSLDGGGQELIDQMQQVGVLNNGERLKYAYGLYLSSYRGLNTVYHSGAWYGYRAELLRFPEQAFSVICLANHSMINPDTLCKKVADLCLFEQDLKNTRRKRVIPCSLSQSSLQDKTGFYRHESEQSIVETTAVGDVLNLSIMGQVIQLIPVDDLTFKAVDALLDIEASFVSEEQMLLSWGDGSEPERYQKMKPYTLSPEQLKEYPNRYFSEELNTAYELQIEDGRLCWSKKNPYFAAIHPVEKDFFNSGLVNLHFFRTGEGEVAGFVLSSGKLDDIRFIKQTAKEGI